jgi:hypothetical protein
LVNITGAQVIGAAGSLTESGDASEELVGASVISNAGVVTVGVSIDVTLSGAQTQAFAGIVKATAIEPKPLTVEAFQVTPALSILKTLSVPQLKFKALTSGPSLVFLNFVTTTALDCEVASSPSLSILTITSTNPEG